MGVTGPVNFDHNSCVRNLQIPPENDAVNFAGLGASNFGRFGGQVGIF